MFIGIQTHSQWTNSIKPILESISTGNMPPEQIIKNIQIFKIKCSAYLFCHSFSVNNNFQILLKNHFQQVSPLFQKASKLILKFDKLNIPLFYSGKNIQYTFSKEEILYIVCLMAMCLVPQQQYSSNIELSSRFNNLSDFYYIFSSSAYKTKTIIEYLKTQLNIAEHNDKLTLKRQVFEINLQSILEEKGEQKMNAIQIQDNKNSIDTYYGQLKVDFANKFIGGGSLHQGCVQEQIMFANHPQMYVSQILCEVMENNQALIFIGFKKYSQNSGYGWTTEYLKQQDYVYKMDQNHRAKEFITAIDATYYHHFNNKQQITEKHIKRQIFKAYCGFNMPQTNDVVTGNWGCGAFNGNLKLKFIIQWIASSLCGKKLIYCPFGYHQAVNKEKFIKKMNQNTIQKIYSSLIKAAATIKNIEEEDIFERIIEYF